MALNVSKPVILMALCCMAINSQAHFFDNHATGWFWYEKEPADKTRNKKFATPQQAVEFYQKELKRLQQIAWVQPTTSNVEKYIRMQNFVMEQSSKFANAWQYVMMQNPELDFTTSYPVAQQARHVYLEEGAKQKQKMLKSLSKAHGLFFFFKGNCRYCHLMAPIVKAFGEKYNWEVIAVSMDGGKLEGFPEIKLNQGQAEKLGIKVVPSLLALDVASKKVIPLAHGFATQDVIEDRAMTIVNFEKNTSERDAK